MDNNIDISSPIIEKGIDAAKSFVGKLIGPAIEETGLLISDNIKSFRFKNQLRILKEAEEAVRKYNIDTKKISFKTLLPLIEYSSLEEEESLQEMWTNLLVNYIDSKKKYESSIYPFILNQLTALEAKDLEKFVGLKSLSAGALNIDDTGLSNLIRLGLITKLLPNLKTESKPNFKRRNEIIVSYSKRNHYYQITQLGEEFLKACSRE